MTAQVVRLGNSIAERYARLMTIDCRPTERAEAIDQYMDFAERLVTEHGFTLAKLEEMIELKRTRLIRQLSELHRV